MNMKNLNKKIGYMLLLVASQSSLAVTDDYLKQMATLDQEWNDYAPASVNVQNLESLLVQVEGIGESLAQERLMAANRATLIKHYDLVLKLQENALKLLDANANVGTSDYCNAATFAEDARLKIVGLYVAEINYLNQLAPRYVNQGNLGLLDTTEAARQAAVSGKVTTLQNSTNALKAVAVDRNALYQANTATGFATCKAKLAQIAEQIAAIVVP